MVYDDEQLHLVSVEFDLFEHKAVVTNLSVHDVILFSALMGSTGFYVSNLHTSQAGNGTTTFNMATPPTPLSTSPDYDSSYGGSTGSLVETCENTSGVMATTPVPVAGKDRSGMKG